MIRIILLCIILIIGGIAHLLDPFSFANVIPLFIPFKPEIIFFTGILEFILALGLLVKKTRSWAAKSTALYFIILLSVHFYISIYEIPMFGFSHPAILWGRTLFQFVFIMWAYSLRKI